MTAATALGELIAVLHDVQAGPVPQDLSASVLRRLKEAWPGLKGSSDTSMHSDKLYRAEELRWEPPVLSFRIERHGATVLGSTRAEVQHWRVDLQYSVASCGTESFRQIEQRARGLDVKPIVKHVLEVVAEGSASTAELVQNGTILWQSDSVVVVRHGALVPGSGFARTVAGRRKRFRQALAERMALLGWRLARVRTSMVFERSSTPGSASTP
jgi:hypothetical protein